MLPKNAKVKLAEGEVMGMDEKMPLEAESENTINEMALSKQELENKALSTCVYSRSRFSESTLTFLSV